MVLSSSPKVCLYPSPTSVCRANSPSPSQHSGCLSLILPVFACLVSSFSLLSFRPVSFFPLSLPPFPPPLPLSQLHPIPTSASPYLCPLLLFCPCLCLATSGFCSHCPCTDLSCCLMCCLSPIVSLRVSTSPCVFPPKSSVSLIGMTNAMRAQAVSGGKSCGNGWNGPVGGLPHSPELFITLVA